MSKAQGSKGKKTDLSTKGKSKGVNSEITAKAGSQAKTGRPSIYTPELAERLCARLATGESLRAICKDPEMPGINTVIVWLGREDMEPFRLQYTRARTLQAHLIEDELLEIVDDTTRDTLKNEQGHETPNSEWISRSRLRYDARRWLLSKMLPKKYGDALDLTSMGESLSKVRVIRPVATNGQ